MRVLQTVAICLGLAACTPTAPEDGSTTPDGYVAITPTFDPPEGYPYPMGNLSGTIGTDSYVLTSYDYSVGAIDPNVWVQKQDDAFQMRMQFESASDPQGDHPELAIEAAPPALLTAGMRLEAKVALEQGKGPAKTVLRKTFAPATLAIDTFTPGKDGSFDRIAGRLTGKMCNPGGGGCVPMDLRFDTTVYQTGG